MRMHRQVTILSNNQVIQQEDINQSQGILYLLRYLNIPFTGF